MYLFYNVKMSRTIKFRKYLRKVKMNLPSRGHYTFPYLLLFPLSERYVLEIGNFYGRKIPEKISRICMGFWTRRKY